MSSSCAAVEVDSSFFTSNPNSCAALSTPDAIISTELWSPTNVWSSEYHGEEYFYVMGALGAYVSQTGHIGYVNAAESPSANASINALMLGALSVNPDIDVSFTYVGSFEDPAAGIFHKGYDIFVCKDISPFAAVCREFLQGIITDIIDSLF